jgi:hypothetical protein
MRSLIVAAALLGCAAPAAAEQKCDYGAPGIFEFVSWQFGKAAAKDTWTEMTLIYRSTLDFALRAHEIRIIAGENAFGFRSEEPVKPGGEATHREVFDMPPEDAGILQKMTPLLCAIGIEDDAGKQTAY